MRDFLRKNVILITILLIVLLGAFLRFYHFSDWLHFELDQSRDAKIIDLAIREGAENLPLLGPKAAGSFLRLGPVFYYFNYLSALVFGNTPQGMAAIIMLFGILAMPAFYILVRRYFDKLISILLLVPFSLSLFLIMYSRFSWNPNALPLFVILTFYALLRAVDKEEKKQGLWLLLFALSLSVAAQLHFLAFVSVPAVVGVFLIFKRPRIRWTYWIGAIAIILMMNSPVILNEIKTGGKNFVEFKKVISGKTNKDSDKTILEKAYRNYAEHSLGYFLILSSRNAELPKLDQKPRLDFKCDQGCRDNLPLGVMAGLIFSAGLILTLKNLIFEKEEKRKDFVILVSFWFVSSFGLFLPLAFDISPRFWLIASALPFIFLGFIFEFIRKKISPVLLFAVVFILSISSLQAVYQRFTELQKAPNEAVETSTDRILKERHRVTLQQQNKIIDYIESFYRSNNYPVYLNSEPFYRRSFLFHLDQKEIPRDDFRNASSSNKVYQNGNYFLIYPTDSNLEKELNDYSASYDIINQKQFGTLTVFQLTPKPEAINAVQQEFGPKGKPKSAPGVPERYTWEEIFTSAEEENTE